MALSYRIFRKNKLSHSLLIFQFVVALLILNLMVGNVNHSMFAVEAFSGIAKLPGYLFMPVNADVGGEEMAAAVKRECTGVKHVASVGQYWFTSEHNSTSSLFGYDDLLYQAYVPEMAKGEWLCEERGGYIPLVISEEFGPYRYGMEFPGKLLYSGGEIPVIFRITGVLKAPGMYLDLNVGGTSISANYLFRSQKAEYSGEPLFLVNKGRLPEIPEESSQVSSLVFFEEDLSGADLEKNLEALKTRGTVNELPEVLARGKEFARDYVILYLPLFLCGFLIALVGMVGASILSVQKNLRSFSVYYFVGCPWKRIARICLGVTILQLAVVTVVLAAVYLYVQYGADLADFHVILNYRNILVTGAAYLLVALATYLAPRVILERNSAMDTFRANFQI